MKRIVVTGGSGKAGRAVVRELVEHGHSAVNVELVPPPEALCRFLRADLNDTGRAIVGVLLRRHPSLTKGRRATPPARRRLPDRLPRN